MHLLGVWAGLFYASLDLCIRLRIYLADIASNEIPRYQSILLFLYRLFKEITKFLEHLDPSFDDMQYELLFLNLL
jgi:hypothetical protein